MDRPDPLQLFLRLPPSPGQAADPAAAAAERDQPDRLQRGLQLSILNAGPQYVHLDSSVLQPCNIFTLKTLKL